LAHAALQALDEEGLGNFLHRCGFAGCGSFRLLMTRGGGE